MTKAFLEPMVLKQENEKFIRKAFSKSNMDRVKKFDSTQRPKLQRTSNRKLSINDLF
ncbi:hypothetical protein [Arcobacter sp. FWKO B]|uniref:hypothetical protein n=1 Tax=Arcobacter sp. FWKO B TaxID=2593672 RepID=UPI0019040DB3|nr:hypothetical protein [Arcobacter sp. FWKO B]